MGWITHSLHQIGESLPLAVHRTLLKRDFIVINYHMVSDQQLTHVAHLFPYKTPEMFERDLIYLQRNFNLVSYDQLADHFSGTKKLPPKAVAVTFDDGFSECYEIVRPILLKIGAPCIFFVSTNTIDNEEMADPQKVSLCIDQLLTCDENTVNTINKVLHESFGFHLNGKQELLAFIKSTGIHNKVIIERLSHMLDINFEAYLVKHSPYMTTAQIQTMDSEGFIIGSHGTKHERFSGITEAQIEEAMANSCLRVTQLTGKESVPFAFPHNADGVSRYLLRMLLSKYPHIGLLFDANGIHDEERFLISRLNGDRTQKGMGEKSDLSINIKKAYIEEIAAHWRLSG